MRTRQAFLVIGLGYGDEGKGTTVDWLVRQHRARLVVRFNGGAQAAHNVVLPDGRHHTFSQFAAGTLAGTETHLSQHMVVNPAAMLREAQALASVFGDTVMDPLSRVSVDADALITTRYHVAANRLRERARGASRHGSCGMGVNETVCASLNDSCTTLRASDLLFSLSEVKQWLTQVRDERLAELVLDDAIAQILRDDLTSQECVALFEDVEPHAVRLWEWAKCVRIVGPEWLPARLREDETVVFEGAQGVLLDQVHGFFPHVTRSTCTFDNATQLLLDAGYDGRVHRWGVSRTYQTRHGAGPMPTCGHTPPLDAGEVHNATGEWQGAWRTGALDLVTLRYAARCAGGLDGLVLTHLDRIDLERFPACVAHVNASGPLTHVPNIHDTWGHAHRTAAMFDVCPVIKRVSLADVIDAAGAPLVLSSRGPTYLDKTPAPAP